MNLKNMKLQKNNLYQIKIESVRERTDSISLLKNRPFETTTHIYNLSALTNQNPKSSSLIYIRD
jgi:hypothetical protein